MALAEAENDRDSNGCILIKEEHIQSTVEMAKVFKDYLMKLNKKDEDAMAAARGNRYDSAVSDDSAAERRGTHTMAFK